MYVKKIPFSGLTSYVAIPASLKVIQIFCELCQNFFWQFVIWWSSSVYCICCAWCCGNNQLMPNCWLVTSLSTIYVNQKNEWKRSKKTKKTNDSLISDNIWGRWLCAVDVQWVNWSRKCWVARRSERKWKTAEWKRTAVTQRSPCSCTPVIVMSTCLKSASTANSTLYMLLSSSWPSLSLSLSLSVCVSVAVFVFICLCRFPSLKYRLD